MLRAEAAAPRRCRAYLSGPLHVDFQQSLAVALRQALDFLDLLEVGQKRSLSGRNRAGYVTTV